MWSEVLMHVVTWHWESVSSTPSPLSQSVYVCVCVCDDWGIADSVTTADKHGWHFCISQKKERAGPLAGGQSDESVGSKSHRAGANPKPHEALCCGGNLLSCLFISYLLNPCCWSKDNTAMCFHSGKNKESLSLRSGCMVLITASTPGKTSQNMCLIAACGQRLQPWVVGLVVHVSDIICGGAHVVINEPLCRDAPIEQPRPPPEEMAKRGGGRRRR